MIGINKREYRILDYIKAGIMKALVLGHSFVRRLRDWMRDNDREMSRGSLDVQLHGVGGRTVRQVYDLDLKRVERIHLDVILLKLGGNNISSCTSFSDVLVRLERLITVLRQKCQYSTIIVAPSSVEGDPGVFLLVLMTARRNGSINFSLENLVLSSRERKSSSSPTDYFHRDGVHLNNSGNRGFFHSILSALRLSL